MASATNSMAYNEPDWSQYGQGQLSALGQLQRNAVTPITPIDERKLSGNDRQNQWLNFGLSLMQAGADPRNNLLSALGAAGTDTLKNVDATKQRQYLQDVKQREGEQSALTALQKYYGDERDFAAGRADASWDRNKDAADIQYKKDSLDGANQYRQDKLSQDAISQSSLNGYRNAKLAQDAEYNHGRSGLLAAQTELAHAKANTAGANGGMKAGQVKLRNGNLATMDDVRQLYNGRYGQYDPNTRQTSFNAGAPTMDQFFQDVVDPASDPFSNPSQQTNDPFRIR